MLPQGFTHLNLSRMVPLNAVHYRLDDVNLSLYAEALYFDDLY